MNKDFKVIQINGLSGLFLLCFLFLGLFFGFIAFPIWVLHYGWNNAIHQAFNFPIINIYQASLLWAFITVLLYTAFRKKLSFKFEHNDEITDLEIKRIIAETVNKKEIDENEESAK